MTFSNHIARPVLLMVLVTIYACCGCGQTETDSTDDSETTNVKLDSHTNNKTVDRDLSERLIGVWYGRPSIDQERLDACLAEIDESDRLRSANVIASFRSTDMAMVFAADGQMQNELEMVIDGDAVRQGATGTWKSVSQAKDVLVVELVEDLEDGSQVTSRRELAFFPDGNRFSIRAPLGEQLSGCGAILVFERQNANQVASESDDQTQRR